MKLLNILYFVVVVFKDINCFTVEENCVYNETFLEPKCKHEEFNITFYIPFNWLTWTDNEELIIIIDNTTFVLRHPQKQLEQSHKYTTSHIEFIPVNTLLIGWNVIFVRRDFTSNEIKIEDHSRQTLGKIFCDYNICEKKIKVKGLLATINCNSGYRYYMISEINQIYRFPLIINDTVNNFTLASENNEQIQVVIYSERKKLTPCYENYSYYYIGDNSECTFYTRTDYNIHWIRNLTNQTYFSFGSFRVTELNLINIGERTIYVKIQTHNFTNISIERILPSEEIDLEISKETLVHLSIHAMSLVVIIMLIMLCHRERTKKPKKVKFSAGTEKPMPSNSKDAYDAPEPELYEIKNELYENFDTRVTKLEFKEETDKNSGTVSSGGNESLYVNLKRK